MTWRRCRESIFWKQLDTFNKFKIPTIEVILIKQDHTIEGNNRRIGVLIFSAFRSVITVNTQFTRNQIIRY